MSARRGAASIAVALLVVAAVAVAAAPGKQKSRKAQLVVAITNSSAGSPLFEIHDMKPGTTFTRTAEVTNTGNVGVQLILAPYALRETPGAAGGRLSGRLALAIDDVTQARARSVYRGPMGELAELMAGRLAPGAKRTYRFAAVLPDGSEATDNVYQGASVAVSYRWRATSVRLDFTRVLGRLRRSSRSLRRPVVVHVVCVRPCRARIDLKATRRTARKLGWRSVPLALVTVRRRSAGQRDVRLRVPRAWRMQLARLPRASLALRVRGRRLRIGRRRGWTITYAGSAQPSPRASASSASSREP
jgi:hypothetical protein